MFCLLKNSLLILSEMFIIFHVISSWQNQNSSIILSNRVNHFSENFLYYELNGKLNEEWKMDFSIYLDDYEGFFLFTYDTQSNKILIQIRLDVLIKINNQIKYFDKNVACGCSECVEKILNLSIKMVSHALFFLCNNQSALQVTLNSKFRFEIKTSGGNPKMDKMFLKVGKIEFSKPPSFNKYKVTGCLDKFSLNSKSFNPKSFANIFLRTCKKQYNERVCHRNKCMDKNVSSYITHCTVADPFKYIDSTDNILRNINPDESFVRKNKSQALFRIVFEGHENLFANCCLVELHFKDEIYRVTFFINSKHQITMRIGEVTKIISTNISFLSNSTFLIHMKDTEIFFKTCFDSSIFTIFENVIQIPEKINVGFSSSYPFCKRFNGIINVRYSTQFYRMGSYMKVFWIILVTMVIIMVIFGISILSIVFIKLKDNKTPIRKINEETVPLADHSPKKLHV